MNKDFSIAFKALKQGLHEFSYKVDSRFFDKFESTPVKSGVIDVELDFHKRTDHFQLDFDIDGVVKTNCDRCTADINLPVNHQTQFIVKFGDEESDDEVIFLPVNEQILNLTDMIYETIVLAMPLIKVYDCESEQPLPCNETVLDYLENDHAEEENNSTDSVWDKLNDLKFNDN